MQIVIDIPNSLYANLKKIKGDSTAGKRIVDCVINGRPLPKGHGRLIDADRFLSANDCGGYIEDMEVDYFNKVTPTIIEADMEVDR